jgi:hypothetical protein
MLKRYLKQLVIRNRDFILQEVLEVKGLMQLLMKHRNTGQKWTKGELQEIRGHFRELSRVIPVLVIFLLPGGSLFLPFLAQVLDRRKKTRL